MDLLSRIVREAASHYLLHLALVLSGAALLYWRTFRARGIPSFTKADYIELDGAREQWLLTHGYAYTGTYCVDFKNPIKFLLNAYTSADGMKACAIIKCTAQAAAVTAFTSRCTPFFVLCLDDYNGGEALGYAPYKTVLHSRAKSIAELSDLHDRLLDECRMRNVLPSPLPATDEGVENMICKGAKRDFEYQVKIGRMRRVGEDRYAPTVRGAVLGVPVVWWGGIKSLFSAIMPRNDAALIAALRSKLDQFWAYPQVEIDFKY